MKSGQRAKVNFKMVGQAAKICQPKEAAKNPKWLPFWADSQSSCPLKNVTNEILSFSHNHLHSTLVSFVWVFRVFFFECFECFGCRRLCLLVACRRRIWIGAEILAPTQVPGWVQSSEPAAFWPLSWHPHFRTLPRKSARQPVVSVSLYLYLYTKKKCWKSIFILNY